VAVVPCDKATDTATQTPIEALFSPSGDFVYTANLDKRPFTSPSSSLTSVAVATPDGPEAPLPASSAGVIFWRTNSGKLASKRIAHQLLSPLAIGQGHGGHPRQPSFSNTHYDSQDDGKAYLATNVNLCAWYDFVYFFDCQRAFHTFVLVKGPKIQAESRGARTREERSSTWLSSMLTISCMPMLQ
jgi:hypothetical protein